MELCDHGSLKDLLMHTTLDQADLWEALVDIALGLEHIHNHGQIHLDIKPANVFVTRPWYLFGGTQLKIGDFGIASRFRSPVRRVGDDDLGSSAVISDELEEGDPVYLAPEIMGSRYRDRPAAVLLGHAVHSTHLMRKRRAYL